MASHNGSDLPVQRGRGRAIEPERERKGGKEREIEGKREGKKESRLVVRRRRGSMRGCVC